MLNGYIQDAATAAVWLMLAVMLAFTVQYVTRGSWRKHPIGWSVVIERGSFIGLLGILLADKYLNITDAGTVNALTLTEAILLACASVGVAIGTAVMWRIQHRK